MVVRVAHPAPTKFKYITQTLAKINDEGDLIFSLDGLIAYLMSPDKTSLAVLRAPITAFDEYTVDEEVVLRVRTDELNKIVRRATRNDTLILEYEPGSDLLKVLLEDRKTGITRTFYLPAMVLEHREVKEPKMEGKARFTLIAEDFKNMIQDAKIVGDVLELRANEEEVRVIASGEEKEYEWIMRDGDPLLSLSVVEESTSTYTINSLQALTKPTGAAESVSVEFESNYPLKATFTFQNTEKLVIYVAPALG
ncbi:MAG: DNA polymerase sliding clamp [Desulfurococcales archaeon]|nr:DNA polymerase sliding clamp [Desulfurococcales archaeon]MCE4623097.1 DNA polymerase sliding clamp [Desulfurococcales archaeon]MCE4626345.1 DNA polymerase sliding clamp [Desulfurococcales archaeon]MCE4629860.1 DNA polymerase sliding clamp [Desulfurococcales archaeon]